MVIKVHWGVTGLSGGPWDSVGLSAQCKYTLCFIYLTIQRLVSTKRLLFASPFSTYKGDKLSIKCYINDKRFPFTEDKQKTLFALQMNQISTTIYEPTI